MKIDCHAHLIGISSTSGGYASQKMRRSIPFRYLVRKLGLHKIKDPEEQDRAYISILANHIASSELDRAVLLAFDEIYTADGQPDKNRSYLYISNDYVEKVCKQHDQLFMYGASVHPYRKDAIEELERVKENGAVLVKLLPNSQGFDPSVPALVAYYRKAAQLELPLLFHCGFEHTIPAIDQKYGEPLKLELALDNGATVIVAHAGSSGRFHLRETFGDFLKVLSKYPRCFGDTSALTNAWRSKYLFWLLNPDYLKSKFGVEIENPYGKFVHGSDYPIPITPWAFAHRISPRQLQIASAKRNPFDVDIALKRFAGVPDDCLVRFSHLIGISEPK